MKKQFFTYVLLFVFICGYQAQTDNWVEINPGHPLNYGNSKLIVKNKSVYLFNSNYSNLLKSSDLGNTWQSLSIASDSSQHEYNDLFFVDEKVGYVAGYDGSMFSGGSIKSVIKKTVDGGITWQNVSTGLIDNSILTSISFYNSTYGVAFGTGNMKTHQYVTGDGGLSWMLVNFAEPDMHQVNYAYTNGASGVVSGVGYYMHIAVTQDQGSTWITRHFPRTTSASGIKFFNSQNGIVVSEDSIFATNNGAFSFYSGVKFPYANFVQSFDMIDMQKGFFCTNTSIYYTADGGNTWKLSYNNPNVQLVSIKVENNHVFANTCKGNYMLKLDISALVTSVSKMDTQEESLFLYPNPAIGSVKILTPENVQLVSVVITDQLGRTVKEHLLTINNQIDVSDLSLGVYQVEVKCSDKKVLRQKLIVARN